jgi:hypothetical protein
MTKYKVQRPRACVFTTQATLNKRYTAVYLTSQYIHKRMVQAFEKQPELKMGTSYQVTLSLSLTHHHSLSLYDSLHGAKD